MKNKILLGCGLLALLTCAAMLFAEDDNDLANTYYQSGLMLLKQNKYDEALEKFNKALAFNKNFPLALCKSGECCEKTGDTKSAIKNYRLGLKAFQDKPEPTKEEKETLQTAKRSLDKLDATGNEARKIRDKHISGLLTIANDTIARQYFFFAARIYKQILEIEPDNKAALDGLEKARKYAPKKPGPPAIPLFNGNDLKGLVVPKIWLPLWNVNKSCLVFNANSSREPSLIQWGKPPAKNYSFSMEMFLEKRLPADNYEISFAYGESSGTGAIRVITNKRIQSTFNRIGAWTKVRFTVQDMKFKIEEGAKTTRSGKIEPCDTRVLGIYAQGYIARFRNLEVETLE